MWLVKKKLGLVCLNQPMLGLSDPLREKEREICHDCIAFVIIVHFA